jgi:hypothetical protein
MGSRADPLRAGQGAVDASTAVGEEYLFKTKRRWRFVDPAEDHPFLAGLDPRRDARAPCPADQSIARSGGRPTQGPGRANRSLLPQAAQQGLSKRGKARARGHPCRAQRGSTLGTSTCWSSAGGGRCGRSARARLPADASRWPGPQRSGDAGALQWVAQLANRRQAPVAPRRHPRRGQPTRPAGRSPSHRPASSSPRTATHSRSSPQPALSPTGSRTAWACTGPSRSTTT